MKLLLILLITLSFPAAAQVYKWTDEQGVTHFGQQPPPGQREKIDVRPASGVAASSSGGAESSIIRQARALEHKQRVEAVQDAQQQYRQDVQQIRQDFADRPDYVCTGAENRLASAEERWADQKRQGYSIRQQRYHEQQIKNQRRSRDNLCR